MGQICDSCIKQEKRYDGALICQHRQSMLGMELEAEYVLCDEVDGCRFHRPTTARCNECEFEDCSKAQEEMTCPKSRR